MAVLADFRTAYIAVWQDCPYTSLKMFETILNYNYGVGTGLEIYMQRVCGRPVGDVTLADLEIAGIPAKTDNAFLRPCWDSRSGLCTSFTIKTFNQVPADAVNKFIYGDGASHRLGWRMDRILVDSSQRYAMQVAAAAPDITFVVDGPLRRTKPNRLGVNILTEYDRVPTWQEAMVICLRQLLTKPDYIVMFRGLRHFPGRAEGAFAGRIDWNIGQGTCIWSVPVGGGGPPRFNKGTAKWDDTGAGTAATNQQCLDSFGQFLDSPIPGINDTRGDQFVDVQAFHDQLWAACIGKFGNPRFIWRANVP